MTDYQPMTEPEQRDYAEALVHWALTKIEPWDVVLQVQASDRNVIDEIDCQAVLTLVK